jgi:hypothetical protein
MRQWLGDARGRWEHDTLVIDTTNLHPQATFKASGPLAALIAEHFHVVEQLRLIDSDTLEYKVTVEDPTTWREPWTALTTWRRSANRIFEYACHESNRAMEGILRGARADENAAPR